MDLLDALAALADPIRGRLLLALERHELAVGELATALQLPQSTVSRHLKTLVDSGWVHARAEGASRHYRLAATAHGGETKALWQAVREGFAALPAARHDGARLRAVLAERRSASRAFFSTSADAWDRLRTDLYGPRADLLALLALLDGELVIGDLGCGTGATSEALAPHVRRVIAVDHSQEMLAIAGRRLDALANVELREGDLEALPIADAELDATPAYEPLASIRTFSEASPLSFSALLRGPTALGTLLGDAGFPSVPSAQDPAPGVGEPYFNGGYSTDRHACSNGGEICGVQIEAPNAGTCTIAADEPGGDGWRPAPRVTQSFAVAAPVDGARTANGLGSMRRMRRMR